jgi:hypothetical protein
VEAVLRGNRFGKPDERRNFMSLFWKTSLGVSAYAVIAAICMNVSGVIMAIASL